MVDPDRLSAAYETARCDLLAESTSAGHWRGQPSSSPLATAAALVALTIVERHAPTTVTGRFVDEHRDCRLSELIMASLRWLARHQNADGGWGDTDRSPSNIGATMLVRAIFGLTCVPADHPRLLERADAYIKQHGAVRGLRRRYGRDRTLVAPILSVCALAGLAPWRKVPAMPFERLGLPQRYWKSSRLPVSSSALPMLLAVGLAKLGHRTPWNPVVAAWRRSQSASALQQLADMQPKSGGYCEDVAQTAFVVTSLASIGHTDHVVVRRGIDFLLDAVLSDGSWPIYSDRSLRNSTRAVAALAAAGEELRELGSPAWLIAAQQRQTHPITGAEQGGWGATDQPGATPTASDTAAALLALSAWSKTDAAARELAQRPAALGVRWLLDLQNSNGGWPMFRRGWNHLPADRAASDLTAHVLRALKAWRASVIQDSGLSAEARGELDARIELAIEHGLAYLRAAQNPDGSWTPLWLGSSLRADGANPVCGTAQVLFAFRDLNRLDEPAAERGLAWLVAAERPDGGWGPPAMSKANPGIEETAMAAEALLTCGQSGSQQNAASRALGWLIDAVEANRHHDSAPIELSPARLWYDEPLYPLALTVKALGQAARRMLRQNVTPAVVHSKT